MLLQGRIINELQDMLVKNIDWSTWKSEFINKILDESMSITSLDDYGVGTWFTILLL